MEMDIRLGIDYFGAREGRRTPISMAVQRLVNAHALLLGMSGAGKSYTIRRMVADAIATNPLVRVHVFDVAGDLEIPGASEVDFSRASSAGLNPFRVNPNPAYGIEYSLSTFLRVIDDASQTKLGDRQVSVLRNLVLDVYAEFGFTNNPATWTVNALDSRLVSGGADNRLYLQVPIAEKDSAKANGARWDAERKLWYVYINQYRGPITRWLPAFKQRTYPCLDDLIEYAERIHIESFLGADQKAIRALGAVEKSANALRKKKLDAVKRQRFDEIVYDEDAEAELEEKKERAKEAYAEYVDRIETGVELERLRKYRDVRVLESVIDRLKNLKASGLFKANSAPFDPESQCWRYKVNDLSLEAKKMFVFFQLRALFDAASERGVQPHVVDIVVLDELGTYSTSKDKDGGDGIIGIIASQARKFGLALWGATQSPATVPEAVSSSVGTKIILGIDASYRDFAIKKFQVEGKLLDWISLKKTMAVQMKEAGATKHRWHWVQIDDT